MKLFLKSAAVYYFRQGKICIDEYLWLTKIIKMSALILKNIERTSIRRRVKWKTLWTIPTE
nr:MAG TPA: hypothetical protein [Caudoviricetes sp.]